MTNKLKALSEVREKISKIQSMYQVKMISEDGFTFDFDIPDSEQVWKNDFDLSDGNPLYKRIKLLNYDNKEINLILYYAKKGSYIKNHNHSESHLMICIDGKTEMIVDNKHFIVKKGESIHIKSFQWHQINFIESSKLIVLYI